MSGKRYTDEFKIEAVKQVTDRGYKISDVAFRLGVTLKSLHDWVKKYGDQLNPQRCTSQASQSEVRLHQGSLCSVASALAL